MDDSVKVALSRTADMAAMFMIGDGVLGLAAPWPHVELWRSRIGAVDGLTRPFQGRPTRRRLYGALQIAAGMALANWAMRRQSARNDT